MSVDRRSVLVMAACGAVEGAPNLARVPSTVPHSIVPPGFAPQAQWEFGAVIQWDHGRHPTGSYRSGQRIYNIATGGSFAGPRLRGEVLPGGGDWALLNPPDTALAGTSSQDRLIQFDARYILRTDDGVHIYVFNRGGKAIPAGQGGSGRVSHAFSTPLFDVPTASPYQFLADNVFIAMSESRPDYTILNVFRMFE